MKGEWGVGRKRRKKKTFAAGEERLGRSGEGEKLLLRSADSSMSGRGKGSRSSLTMEYYYNSSLWELGHTSVQYHSTTILQYNTTVLIPHHQFSLSFVCDFFLLLPFFLISIVCVFLCTWLYFYARCSAL